MASSMPSDIYFQLPQADIAKKDKNGEHRRQEVAAREDIRSEGS